MGGDSGVSKKCSNCGELKHLDLFGKNKRTKDGLHYYCKECQNSKTKEYFKTEKGKQALKEYQSKYYKTKKGKESLKKYQSKYYKTEKGKESLKKYFQSEKGKEALKKQVQKKQEEGYYRFGKGAIPILRAGATKRGISFNLTAEKLENWWLSKEDICHYCDMPIEEFKYLRDFILNYEGENRGVSKFKRAFVTEKQAKINWMTLDRRDNNLGYELDNIVKCCWFCNFIKRDFLSEDDMLQIAEGIINRLRNEIQKEIEYINPNQ